MDPRGDQRDPRPSAPCQTGRSYAASLTPVAAGVPGCASGALVAALLLVAAWFMAACRPGGEADVSLRIPEKASPVEFEGVLGDASPLRGPEEPARLVFRSSGPWSEFWTALTRRAGLRPARPTVDFDREIVIAAAMGERSTGGYAISVRGVYESGGRIYVDVLETVPGPGCMLIQAVTSPLDLIRVWRTGAEVVFVESTEIQTC